MQIVVSSGSRFVRTTSSVRDRILFSAINPEKKLKGKHFSFVLLFRFLIYVTDVKVFPYTDPKIQADSCVFGFILGDVMLLQR